MNYFDDTIAAISTPIGQGGIGIVRISGPKSLAIAERIFRGRRPDTLPCAGSFTMHYGQIADPRNDGVVDEVILSVMRGPGSYTKEDIVEINCHGGMVSVRETLELVLSLGARMAEPGEFTKRAFLNGRISLNEAEAVLDLIAARTEESMRIAADQIRGVLSVRLAELKDRLVDICSFVEAHIDFPEEDFETKTFSEVLDRLHGIGHEMKKISATFQEARFFREGLSVAIVGRPNVGKSSLLNALLKKDRAIVTEFPGTTRDLIEEYLNIKGLPVRIIDTAGIRDSVEAVEKEGIRRSLDAMEKADFVIAVLDGSEALKGEDFEILARIRKKNSVIAINKTDLPVEISLAQIALSGRQYLHISAVAGRGLDELKSAIFDSNLGSWKEEREGVVVTNMRHKLALDKAAAAVGRAMGIIEKEQPLELFSVEMRDALDGIGEITGAVATEDILNKIFSEFCIGK
jgi:tRNA modification GTPase